MFELNKNYLFYIKRPNKISFYHGVVLEESDNFIRIKDKYNTIRIINKSDIIEAEVKV